MHVFSVKTRSRNEMVDITAKVKQAVSEAGVKNGICTVYCPHTTAAITINENADPDVPEDILMKLRKMVPPDEGYAHREGNSDAHIKSSLVGNTAQLLVENGQIELGTWQGIFFCEFDGARSRKVWIQVK